jgi:citrate lyase subunit beta/citryl-CoA lyase
VHIQEIARSSDRLETLIFGPADMSTSLGVPTVHFGGSVDYPGDRFHAVLTTILVAARAAGLQAIDGPYPLIHDVDGLRAVASRSRALGYDGKWALHPAQIEVLNDVYRPSQEEFDLAAQIVEAYRQATDVDSRGAVMLGEEMLDEASRKLALQLLERGARAGMTPSA